MPHARLSLLGERGPHRKDSLVVKVCPLPLTVRLTCEKEYLIIGRRHGKRFRLGDSVRVRVAKNAFRSENDFELVQTVEPGINSPQGSNRSFVTSRFLGQYIIAPLLASVYNQRNDPLKKAGHVKKISRLPQCE